VHQTKLADGEEVFFEKDVRSWFPWLSLEPSGITPASALNKDYDTNAIRDRLAKDGIEPVIPPKSNCKE
jgi:hypothetical protein